uniref:Tick transposon n=1 Tax=Rhipicephalus pulchellus TaxID=72859 RepID=L7M005_RHIPC
MCVITFGGTGLGVEAQLWGGGLVCQSTTTPGVPPVSWTFEMPATFCFPSSYWLIVVGNTTVLHRHPKKVQSKLLAVPIAKPPSLTREEPAHIHTECFSMYSTQYHWRWKLCTALCTLSHMMWECPHTVPPTTQPSTEQWEHQLTDTCPDDRRKLVDRATRMAWHQGFN